MYQPGQTESAKNDTEKRLVSGHAKSFCHKEWDGWVTPGLDTDKCPAMQRQAPVCGRHASTTGEEWRYTRRERPLATHPFRATFHTPCDQLSVMHVLLQFP